MRKIALLFSICLVVISCKAQNTEVNNTNDISVSSSEKPKLVVGIVVDQMRYDYLTRFSNKFGEGGFKRLMREGFNCKNNHFNYIPTKTGPGHASIFTGTTPKYHGIIGNDWFSKELNRKVNCVEDNSVTSVGSDTKDGKKSPVLMLASTIGDENRLFTQMKGKTIGISIKHRGAILPAGHSANAAYWWDYDHDGSGNWISSSYYMKELPKWVMDFNNSGKAASYFKVWNTLNDISTYTESGSDNNTYERVFNGETHSTFPHDLRVLKTDNKGFKVIAESPFGNTLTTDFALEALKGEALGQDNYTDVFTISYSSTDKVGHDYGPNSIEVEDTYIRLDKDLERLLNALDASVGIGEYTLFLTADHGAPHVINYLKDSKIPSGLFDLSQMFDEVNNLLSNIYNVENLVLSRINNQIFFDHKKVEDNNLNLQELKTTVAKKLLSYSLVSNVYATSDINTLSNMDGYQEQLLFKGFHQKRSGDIIFTFNPAVFKDTPWNRTGTDHHSGYNYDTHVPLLFFGKGIRKGETLQKTVIPDIATTISALLGISFPNAATGQPLEFILD